MAAMTDFQAMTSNVRRKYGKLRRDDVCNSATQLTNAQSTVVMAAFLLIISNSAAGGDHAHISPRQVRSS
jgi:hypothetical protein